MALTGGRRGGGRYLSKKDSCGHIHNWQKRGLLGCSGGGGGGGGREWVIGAFRINFPDDCKKKDTPLN